MLPLGWSLEDINLLQLDFILARSNKFIGGMSLNTTIVFLDQPLQGKLQD